jgi:mannitol 2-dehydrogenase
VGEGPDFRPRGGSPGAPITAAPSVRLTAAALPAIAARDVAVPDYDRTALAPRILHIGVGGFHRAHMALYTDELAAAGSDWGIRGAGLLAHDARMAEALVAQDHLYTLIERGTGAPTVRVIGSIIDYRLTNGDVDAAAALVADPDVAIVSLTITEAGYADPVDDPATPSTFDAIARGLQRRHDERWAPVAIVSCDNLPGNGDVTRRATAMATRRRSSALATWTEAHCTFPNSMVDRITPATTEADRVWLRDSAGIDDRWPVVAEPFRQWVIEDAFASGRPRWEQAGVLFSDRVHDWELYKLRILNAGHSGMAYLAALAGITYVDEAMTRPEIRHFLDALLRDEALPTLVEIPGHTREAYLASVLERFTNTGVRDQIARLCIDGSAKYPTFLVPTIKAQLARGGPIAAGALALAGWGRYLAETPPERQAFDANGEAARRHALAAERDPVRFLDYAAVFPPDVRDDDRFRATFAAAWRGIGDVGPLDAMAG